MSPISGFFPPTSGHMIITRLSSCLNVPFGGPVQWARCWRGLLAAEPCDSNPPLGLLPSFTCIAAGL